LDYLRDGGKSERINLGNGHGYSVLEVIEAARQVTGKPIEVRIEPPRLEILRSSSRCRICPHASGLAAGLSRPVIILESDWKWRVKHPDGYAAD
jgi:UDP-glucose 4-epimerase